MKNHGNPDMVLRPADWLIGSGLALASLGLYLITLAPTVLEADAGEFQFVPWLPGIAHPTGYPLYTLLGWVWTHIVPIGEVAWRMNLLSAVLAALAIGLTYGVTRCLARLILPTTPVPAQRITAAVAAATFAVTPTFWSQAIIAEVYALHTLFVVLVLWLVLNFHGRNFKWTLLAAVTLGLALTHHVTTILLLPALLLYIIWRYQRSETQPLAFVEKAKLAVQHAVLLLLPLALYLYLPIIAPLTPYATLSLSENQTLTLYDNSLQGFLKHVTATVFTADLQPTAFGPARLRLAWELLQQQVGWAGVIVALTGVVALWRQRRVDLLLLTGLGFLAFGLFNLIYTIGDVFVLFIPAWLFLCLWLGIGSLSLTHWLAGSFVQRKTGPDEPVIFHRMRTQLQRNAYRSLMIALPPFFLFYPGSSLSRASL